MTAKDFMFCYSTNLQFYLRSKGFEYILKALHPTTCKMFWLYEQSPELSQALKEYRDNNPRLKQE